MNLLFYCKFTMNSLIVSRYYSESTLSPIHFKRWMEFSSIQNKLKWHSISLLSHFYRQYHISTKSTVRKIGHQSSIEVTWKHQHGMLYIISLINTAQLIEACRISHKRMLLAMKNGHDRTSGSFWNIKTFIFWKMF